MSEDETKPPEPEAELPTGDEPPEEESDVPPPPPAVEGAGLESIVDDVEPREEAQAWAWLQLRRGRDGEDVVADLMAVGWDLDDAEVLVEAARKDPGPSEAAAGVAPMYRPRGGILGALVNGIVGLVNALTGIGSADDDAKRADRIRRGQCANCGLDLHGSGGPCPNCGTQPPAAR